MPDSLIEIEVAYALSDRQVVIHLALAEPVSAAAAIEASGIVSQFPELENAIDEIGIFSQICSPEKILKSGDRVEIYRPLRCDPKEARRQRAARLKG